MNWKLFLTEIQSYVDAIDTYELYKDITIRPDDNTRVDIHKRVFQNNAGDMMNELSVARYKRLEHRKVLLERMWFEEKDGKMIPMQKHKRTYNNAHHCWF